MQPAPIRKQLISTEITKEVSPEALLMSGYREYLAQAEETAVAYLALVTEGAATVIPLSPQHPIQNTRLLADFRVVVEKGIAKVLVQHSECSDIVRIAEVDAGELSFFLKSGFEVDFENEEIHPAFPWLLYAAVCDTREEAVEIATGGAAAYGICFEESALSVLLGEYLSAA
jgi:hypothetical protein